MRAQQGETEASDRSQNTEHIVEISPLYSIRIYSLYKNYLHLIHFFKIQAAKQHTNQIQNYKISYIYHLPFSKVTDVSYIL